MRLRIDRSLMSVSGIRYGVRLALCLIGLSPLPVGAQVAAADLRLISYAVPQGSFAQATTSRSRTAVYVLVGAGTGALLGGVAGAVSWHLHPGDSESFSRTTQIVSSAVAGGIVGAFGGWVVARIRRNAAW
jgi:hypothetical protein